jgi:hypothetical protein
MSIRPTSFDFPLFLHVLGAMALVGAVLAAAIVSFVAWPRPDVAILRRAALRSLLFVAVPAYVAMRAGAQWIYSKEGLDKAPSDPTWIGIGFGVADAGLAVLLVTIGVAYWWSRSGKAVPGRIVAGLSSVYLVLLAVAWLAMSGKWG